MWAFPQQIKYKQLAEMEKANYTSVVDTPEIIHAQQVKNLSSQVFWVKQFNHCSCGNLKWILIWST